MSSQEIFIPPKNPLEGVDPQLGLLGVCRNWQEIINRMETPGEKVEAAAVGVVEARKIDGLYGTREVLVKSELALAIDDRAREDEPVCATRFHELVIRGLLLDVVYLQLVDHPSIAWHISDVRVLAVAEGNDTTPPTAEEMDEESLVMPTGRLRKPLYFPVEFIEGAVCAA